MNIFDYMFTALGIMAVHYFFEKEKYEGRRYYHFIIEYGIWFILIFVVDKIGKIF